MHCMATVTVRNLDDEIRRLLRIRAARNDRSMEAEIREILGRAVASPADTTPGGRRARGRSAQLARGPAADLRAGVLTPREATVASLVAKGLTNRQIAAQLYVSERTVESHVSAILSKLGLRSRTAVAARYAHRDAQQP